MSVDAEWLDLAHDGLDRLRRAMKRRTGCYLTAEMVEALSVSFLGELCSDERPPQDDAS